jgi:hypothetical protein
LLPIIPEPSVFSSAVEKRKHGILKTIILPVVLYRCETWSLTLREEHRLRVFENRVLRRIFGLKRDEVTGGWRKLHNEELHNLYSSPAIIMIKFRRMKWAGHVARMGEKRNAYRLLVGKPKGKKLVERSRPRWVDNIKLDLGGIMGVLTGLVWIRIASNGGILRLRGGSLVTAHPVATRVVLSCIELGA